jgi:hypothetical protein
LDPGPTFPVVPDPDPEPTLETMKPVLRIHIGFNADSDPAVYLNAEKFAKRLHFSKRLKSVRILIRILPSTCKPLRKNLVFYSFVTS